MEITTESPNRLSSASSSPEFEFWKLRNPPSSNPQLPLLSADELFADGILLPLHNHSLPPTSTLHPSPPSPSSPPPENPPPSTKWKKYIFKQGKNKLSDKKDRKPSSTSAEINIHIWPFSRSRSSGNIRPNPAHTSTSRKTSSAPCSRCNSHGDSSKQSPVSPAADLRKWAPNQARTGGIYLGRRNPVCQIRRRAGKKDNGGAGVSRVINLNVNSCIGHQRSASCRDCEKEGEVFSDDRRSGGGGVDADGGEVEGNGGLFKLKAIFSRKVY